MSRAHSVLVAFQSAAAVTNPTETKVNDWIRADGIVVLAYRDVAAGPDGIIDHASTEVALAARANKPVILGVETAPAGLDKITFAEEGVAAMEGQLAQVVSAYQSVSSFDGIAIHHYGSYRTLVP